MISSFLMYGQWSGLIMTQRRTNMNEQLFRDLVFLRVNQKLL